MLTAGVDGALAFGWEPAAQTATLVSGSVLGWRFAGSPSGGSGDSINCGDAGAERVKEAATQPVADDGRASPGGFFSRCCGRCGRCLDPLPVYPLIIAGWSGAYWLFHADGVVDNNTLLVSRWRSPAALLWIPQSQFVRCKDETSVVINVDCLTLAQTNDVRAGLVSACRGKMI